MLRMGRPGLSLPSARLRARSALLPASIAAAALAAPWGCSSEADEPGAAQASAQSGAGGAGSASASSVSSSGAVVGPGAGSGGIGAPLPDEFTIEGVVTDGEAPLEGALVMQAGGEPAMVTGPDGAFKLTITKQIPGVPTVVAAKVGYRTRGVELTELPEEPVTLALLHASPPDNIAYDYGDPGSGDLGHDTSTKYCGHCHTTFAKQFQASAHARATRDPLVQDLYAGVTRGPQDKAACEAAGGAWRTGLLPGTSDTPIARCYLGGGVLPDLNPGCGGATGPSCDDPALPGAARPAAFGRCADCHAAGMDGPAGGRDLLDATGIAFENGNHCDACHHVRDVDLSKPPGTGGALMMQRPKEAVSDEPGAKLYQVMFGPLPDVPLVFMGGSYQPKFREAVFCGGCHEQRQEALLPGAALDVTRWPEGLPTHSTFSEWSDGPFNTPGTACQFCHMPPVLGLKSTIDITTEENASMVFGFVRPPEDIRSHLFRGPLEGGPPGGDARLIDGAVTVFLTANASGGEVTATVTLKNTGAGHAVPTGEPMRSLLLLVRAEACGAALSASGGMTLGDVGGAAAEGVIGADVSASGAALAWPSGAAKAKPGDVVRAVRPTGVFDDYEGTGFFANPALTAAEKGIEVRAPVGEASVVSASAGSLTLSGALAVQAGDIVYLGDAAAWPPVDGQASAALAGSSGHTFARVLTDPQGERGVPHYRAVDMASDNRIPPQGEATSAHSFSIPAGCEQASVTAVVVYRPVPVGLARQRAWDAKDYVIASAKELVPLP